MGKHTMRFGTLLATLIAAFCMALAISALAAPSPIRADEPEPEPEDKVVVPADDALYTTGEMLVVFQEGTSDEAIAQVIQEAETADPQGEMVDGYSGELDSSYVVDTPMDEVVVSVVIDEDTSFEDAALEIAASEDVVYVQPNFLYVLMDEDDAQKDAGDGGDSEPDEAAEPDEIAEVEEDSEDLPAEERDASSEEEEPNAQEADEPLGNEEPFNPDYLGLQAEALEAEELEAATAAGFVDVGTNDYTNVSQNNWHLGAINARGAWGLIIGETTVTVAVLDTGCDIEHEDLTTNLDTAHAYQMVSNSGTAVTSGGVTYTFTPQTPGPLTTSFGTRGDINGHGTHVCGIIGAEVDNGIGIAGVSCNRAKVLPVNIFNTAISSSGATRTVADTATVVSAYEYLFGLIKNGSLTDLRIINMSLGGYNKARDDDITMHNAIAKALDTYHILTVVSAGNNNSPANSWPSDYDECISVTATNSDNSRWTSGSQGSDFNSCKDIAAPGAGILSTIPGGNYEEKKGYGVKSGTSMAAPMVSGTLALMYAANPDLTAEEARDALFSSATDLGDPGLDDYYGWGLVNAEEAVLAVVTQIPVPKAKAGLSYTGREQVGVSTGAGYSLSGTSRAIDAGTYTATATPETGYAWPDGTIEPKTISWKIAPAKVGAPTARTGLVYTGSAQTGVAAGTGYTLSGTSRAVGAGAYTATATLSDTANYTWPDGTTKAKTLSWSISAASLGSATISPIAKQPYSGSAIKPAVTVKVGGRTLKAGTDYTVSYKGNVAPGTATVSITGTGGYTGTKTASFAIAEPFADVTQKTSHYASILWLYANGISTGFINGSTRTFQPYSSVARCDMAAFLYRLAGSPTYTPTSIEKRFFSDVSASTPHAKEIWWLAHEGISTGWTEPNGTRTFRPYESIARCDMAAFLYRLAGNPSHTPTSKEQRSFSDVSASTPHAKEVWWLASTGVSTGWIETGGLRTFRPYGNVARCDMAAFLQRMASKSLVPQAE